MDNLERIYLKIPTNSLTVPLINWHSVGNRFSSNFIGLSTLRINLKDIVKKSATMSRFAKSNFLSTFVHIFLLFKTITLILNLIN